MELGQKVWIEPRSHRQYGWREPHEATVTKIGRKWVTVVHGHVTDRFETEDGEGPFSLDGGDYSSPGRVWLSLEARDRYVAAGEAWEQLTQQAGRGTTPPPHLTAEDILKVVALIKGPTP